ncbi:hypothetical protein D3C85_1580130 [compost metagenome]
MHNVVDLTLEPLLGSGQILLVIKDLFIEHLDDLLHGKDLTNTGVQTVVHVDHADVDLEPPFQRHLQQVDRFDPTTKRNIDCCHFFMISTTLACMMSKPPDTIIERMITTNINELHSRSSQRNLGGL